MRARSLLLAILVLFASCTVNNVTFTNGDDDDSGDGAVDAPGADSAIDGVPGSLGVVVSTTDLTVTEGMTLPVTVSLTAAPPSSVLVTIESSDDTRIGVSPTAVLFDPSNWNMPQTVNVTGKQDADVSDETGSITLSSTAIPSPVVVAVTVDDDDGQSLSLSATSLDVGEGSTGSVTAHLTAQPVANVVVDVVSSNTAVATTSQSTLTYTPANWAIDQTITVTGVADANAVNDTATISFSSPDLTSTSVAIQVTDRDVLGIAVSSSSVSATEGGSGTFTVNLTQQPTGTVTVAVASGSAAVATVSPATLTFTTTDYMTPQTVTATAVNDDDTTDGATTLTLSATGLTNRTVAMTVRDDDVQSIISTPTPTLSVAEGGTSQLALSLAFRPSSAVTLAVTSMDTTIAAVTPATVTFSTSNYSVPQMVTVSGVQDADAVPDTTAIHVESAALGISKDVPTTVTDDDTAGITVSSMTLAVTEGMMTMFTVQLSAQPTATTTVAFASSDTTAVTTSPASVSFTSANWNMPQMVIVNGVQDADLVGEAVTLTASASGLPNVTINVAVTDNDTQAIVATPTTVAVTEGATSTFGVTLAFMPSGNVTVNVASANGAIATASPAALTFTPANYATAQPVTVGGVEDPGTTNDTTMVALSATGLATANVTVNVTDNDALNLDVSPTTQTIGEAGSGTLQVRLTAMPAATTTVTLASSDTGAVALGATSLTFTTTNYSTFQPVTVSGVNDADAANESVTITVSSTGLPNATATVNVTDDDPQSIVLSQTTATIGEGGMLVAKMHLGAQPGANTTVTLASSDSGAATVSPASLTFTPANWNIDQPFTIVAVQDVDVANEALTISGISPGITTAVLSVAITDDDVEAIQVSQDTITVNEGSTFAITVALAFQPTSNLTVTLASANGAIADVTPTSLLFTPANYATAQTIQISGTEDPNVANDTTAIGLTAPGATSATIAVTVRDNDTLGIVLAPTALTLTEGGNDIIKAHLTAQPSADVTVSFASSDPGAVTVTSPLTFTTSNWNSNQGVTVVGVQDADLADENVTITATSPGVTTQTASVTVKDDDSESIVVSTGSLRIVEGNTDVIGVSLAFQPTGVVTVNVGSSNPVVTVGTPTLQFTPANYSTVQNAIIKTVADADFNFELSTITITSAGLATKTVGVTVLEPNILVAPSLPTFVCLGDSVNMVVKIQGNPNSTLPVTITTTPNLSSFPAGVTFDAGNFGTGQNVEIDAGFQAGTGTVTLSSPGINPQSKNIAIRPLNQTPCNARSGR